MSILSTGLEKLEHLALAPTAVRTSNLDGTAVDLNDYEGDVVLILDVANGGTSTLDVKIQSADTLQGGSYGDVTTVFYRGGSEVASSAVAFSQVSTTASKQYIVFPKGAAKRYVKAVSTTSSSSHTYSINAVAVKKYA